MVGLVVGMGKAAASFGASSLRTYVKTKQLRDVYTTAASRFIEEWEREYTTLVQCLSHWIPDEIVPLVPGYDWFHDPFFSGDKHAIE